MTVPSGTAINPIGFTVTDTINIGSWKIGGNLPPGLSIIATQNASIMLTGPGILDATSGGAVDPYDPYATPGGGNMTTTPVLMGTPTTAGSYTFTLQAFEFPGAQPLASNTFSFTVVVTGAAAQAPTVTTQPTSQAASAGASITLTAGGSGSPTFQWQRNGVDVGGGTNASLTLANLQPANTGIYTAVMSNGGGAATSNAAIVGLNITAKAIGNSSELAANILHPNGKTFDQILIDGPAAAMTADAGQVLRTSLIDQSNDIVQLEFSGAGTLSIVIDGASAPAAPANYNQSNLYVKGHVGVVVTGADETTNLGVFSVGRGTAVNQALFKDNVTYDGFADIAYIAIQSPTGKFGGLRAANASFFATKGFTGLYAPGINFQGPVFLNDINAFDAATPVLVIGSGSDVRITGGDLLQANGRAIQVAGLTQLKMADGTTSHYKDASTPNEFINAKANRGRLEQNGVDVTSQIVVNPGN